MPLRKDFRWITPALLLAWGFYIHYKNKRRLKKDPNAVLEEVSIPRVIGYPRVGDTPSPKEKKSVRFDTIVFGVIVLIAVLVYISDPSGCTAQ